MNIGEKIRRLRTEKLMTQNELAGDQITRNMLSLVEKGRAVPSLQTVLYLAERLKVSPGYLLADEQEEGLFLKSESLSEIRLAYSQKNYSICLDLCRRLEKAGGKDDELSMIMAECALALGKEQLLGDRLRRACLFFDEAVQYAMDTIYNSEAIKATAWLYFEYLGKISPTISSENLEYDAYDSETAGYLSFADPFCRYLAALALVEGDGATERQLATLLREETVYSKHVAAKMYMKEGDYERAGNELSELLRRDDHVPSVVLYHVFGDLEECCRHLGNQKNARLYAEARVGQFEKLMS